MIDQEEHLKKREVLIKHYKGDVVKATKFIDLNTESRLLHKHKEWAQKEVRMSEKGAP